MRQLLICLVLFIFPFQISAQESEQFTFNNNRNFLIISGVDKSEVKEHPLGNEVAEKLVLLKDRYTYVQPAGPTSPVEKTIISKPAIYNSIQKLNRFYKKELKSDTSDIEKARADFLICIDIALIIHTGETDDFEKYLSKMSKPEEILSAYKQVILK